MEFSYFLLAMAALCFVLCIGLQSRAAWVWYGGWVIWYLLAGYLTSPFFGPLFAGSTVTLKWDLFTLLGGMVFWVAGVVWWCRQRDKFGKRRRRPAPPKNEGGEPKADVPVVE